MILCRYLFILICCKVATLQSEITNVDNVGTVLFSSSDIRKKQWKPSEIGLLHARRHFQTLIPHPHTINTDEDFINSMLSYFKECYSSVKREAKDAETDTIMNAALSDAIGGFLKVWLLPAAKFAYYGGTVSLEDTKKLFQFYDEIKTCLKTNGKSWHRPDLIFLKSLTVTVTPQWFPMTRGVGDQCDKFAYFEKTDSGLTIPVPKVNWDNETASMFVPLKNQTLIPLHSSITDSLFKYYDAATNCMEASKLDEQFKFKNRFQYWLAKEVIPHLNDDVLYPAFGNVLTLVDSLKNVADSSLHFSEIDPEVTGKRFFAMPTFITSKKMLIIYLIVALEVVCCIPTLCYLIWVKIRKDKCKNVYLYIEKGRKAKKPHNSNTDQCASKCKVESKPVSGIDLIIHHSKNQERNQKYKPYDKDCISESPYLSTSSKQLQGSDSMLYISTEIEELKANVIYERPQSPKKKISKKISNDIDTQKSFAIVTRDVRRVLETSVPNESDSMSTIQLGRSDTVTIVNERQMGNSGEPNTDRQFSGKQKLGHSVSATPVVTKTTPDPHDKVTHNSESYVIKRTSASYPPSDKNLRNQNKSRQDILISAMSTVTNTSHQKSRITSKQNEKQQSTSQVIKTSSDSPDIEITIDCQSLQTKVKSGANNRHSLHTKTRSGAIDCQSLQTKIKSGDSKIPKKANGSHAHATATKLRTCSSGKRKSLIPLPRRQKTSDDIKIKKKSTSNQNDILNKTL